MSYQDPKLVRSPKNAIRHLNVLFDGGPQNPDGPNELWQGFSVAEFEYYETPTMGLRWNGYNGSVGHPNTRGIATWEVIPQPFQDVIRELVARKHREAK